MKDKQLTLKEILNKIVKSECLSCGRNIDKDIKYHWRIPLCKGCREEAAEDLEESHN